MKIDFEQLKAKLRSSGEITILSTDTDNRYDEAVKIINNEVPNIKYVKVDEEYINNFDQKEQLFDLYRELRKDKESEEQLSINFKNPNVFANLLVKQGLADGIVSGATHPTSEILRPAFQIIKTTSKEQPISSFMVLDKDNERNLFFADVSVLPEPTAEQLAYIAKQTADSVENVFGIKATVAMLSFSTNGSGGKVETVLKVQEATNIAKELGVNAYGDIQWDAAFREDVFVSKMKLDESPESMPNVFIFPDLNSGNIGYKIASTLGGYKAIGPILQNIAKPVNDLSRGCTPQEIADLVIITALQTLN